MNTVYEEVYNFIEYLGDDYIKKIPDSLLNYLKSFKKSDSSFSKESSLDQIYLSRDAIALLSTIHLKYWVNDDIQKQELINLYNDNEIKFEEHISVYKNSNWLSQNTQKSKTTTTFSTNSKQSVEMVCYKLSFLERIKNYFKKIF